jgi:hypothetical protein
MEVWLGIRAGGSLKYESTDYHCCILVIVEIVPPFKSTGGCPVVGHFTFDPNYVIQDWQDRLKAPKVVATID